MKKLFGICLIALVVGLWARAQVLQNVNGTTSLGGSSVNGTVTTNNGALSGLLKGDGGRGTTAAAFTDVQALAPGILFTNGLSVAATVSNSFTVDATHFYEGNGSHLTGISTTPPTNSPPITLSFSSTNVAVSAVTPAGCVTNALLPYRLTMTTNALVANPTGALDGQRITIEFIQDATGSRLAYFDTKFAFGTDITGITLTTTASKRDFATFVYNSTADKFYCVGLVRGF